MRFGEIYAGVFGPVFEKLEYLLDEKIEVEADVFDFKPFESGLVFHSFGHEEAYALKEPRWTRDEGRDEPGDDLGFEPLNDGHGWGWAGDGWDKILVKDFPGVAGAKLRARADDARDFLEDIRATVQDLRDAGVTQPVKEVLKTIKGRAEDIDGPDSAFQYGVASGDPEADSVVLWTHARPLDAEPGEPVVVYWEVAIEKDFREVVDRGVGTTDDSQDYTFKTIAEGLKPGGEYYYRFKVEGEYSDVGQTRTLPEGHIDSVTFAVFSCSDYSDGFFNAFDAAVQNGFDYSIHLGDYIYETGIGDNADELVRLPSPPTEIVTLDDYSARYAQYTSDEDLQALRAGAPMIMMWDDHETANDSWESGAENHNPEDPDAPEFGVPWEERRDAALEAYFRWNPIREPESGDLRDHNKTYEFGDLVDLHMMETRLQARDETRGDILRAVEGRIDSFEDPSSTLLFEDAILAGVSQDVIAAVLASGDATAVQTLFAGIAIAGLVAEAVDPSREMIGAEQLAELVDKIEDSDATWQMLGSQTLMGRIELPAEVLLGLEALVPLFVKSALGMLSPEEDAFLDSFDDINEVPANFDAWDGYQAEREVILNALLASESGAIVIAGDTHSAWSSNLRTQDGKLAAVEFGGPSVTAPGLLEYLEPVPNPETGEPVDFAKEAVLRYVDDLLYANLKDRGYMSVEVSAEQVKTDYVYVSTTQSKTYETETDTQIALLSDFDYFDFA